MKLFQPVSEKIGQEVAGRVEAGLIFLCYVIFIFLSFVNKEK